MPRDSARASQKPGEIDIGAECHALVLSGDGAWVVAATSAGLCLIDTATQRVGGRVDVPGGLRCVAASPDSPWWYAGTGQGEVLRVDPGSRSIVGRAQPVSDEILALAVNAQHVVAGVCDLTGNLFRLDPQTIEIHKQYEGFEGSVSDVAILPDRRIVAACEDTHVRQFASGSGVLLSAWRHSQQPGVMVLSVAAYGHTVAAAADNGEVVVWRNGEEVGRLVGTCVRFSADGTCLATSDGGRVNQYDSVSLRQRSVTTLFKGWSDSVISLVFTRDGRHIAAASDAGRVMFLPVA